MVVAAVRIFLFLVCAAAWAQDPYPAKPIRLIVSFTPGGGANGLVGAGAVASAAPDGYTMLLTDRGALGINPSLYRSLPYDPTRDFAYIGVATVASYVLVCDPRLPVKMVKRDIPRFRKLIAEIGIQPE